MLLKRKYLFGTTILAGVMVAAAPALAQETQLPGVNVQGQQVTEATQIEEVVVTGSRIRRDPTNAPTPLIQVSREELLSTGLPTVIDYLATIPALSNSVVPSDTTGSGLGDGGLSLANLRSLGSNRTLTLVDGRRHVGSNGGSLAVDVDAIPRLLIENIEIITGGASSVYGADAVSGVLNFVLRKDFEGLEIDTNYATINSEGEATRRISVLAGANFFDDRLNIYTHGEYEEIDEVQSYDIRWLQEAKLHLGVDADPTNPANGPASDGIIDAQVFSNLRRIDRPRWGQTTLAGGMAASPLNDPDVPFFTCNFAGGFNWSASCFAVEPGRTFWYDGPTARLANFGQRVGNTGVNRPYNIGGDGVNPSDFSTASRLPQSTSSRFQTGLNFEVTPNITAYAEAKYIEEETSDISQPSFFDIDLINSYGSRQASPLYGTASFEMRWSDNAFLPQIVKDAIATNMAVDYTAPTLTTPGQATAPVLTRIARHTMFGPERSQDNTRELSRYVAGLRGGFDQFAFVQDISWDLSYTYGQVEVRNIEQGLDVQRFQWAADSVVDTAGVMGTPGAIVCRISLAAAEGVANGQLVDYWRGGDIRDTAYGQKAINECVPLNVFGVGNQDPAALAYTDAFVDVTERNEQEQAVAFVSGTLWDFWGAGRIGVALGAEHRREYTEATGRDRLTAGRFLFLNGGADFPGAEYESDEWFAELSIPLFRDSWLGEYAELSGSYRSFDYTTAGKGDVYGVNLVYRPIQDIAFKTSFNTSFRAPDLNENFSPYGETFQFFDDPCDTENIAALNDSTIKANRIANCTALAADQGLTFDFANATPADPTDDFDADYPASIGGVIGGNPFLKPETSESFTFSTVLQPRFFPNFSLVLDYYEIEIEDVIQSIAPQTAANNCVSGPSLNAAACATIFRNNPDIPFGIGAPLGDPIGGFIQGSVNYASLTTRGLDFTARYSLDIEESFGRNWGRLDYSIAGLWLIEQEDFLNEADPTDYVSNASNLFFPRVRFTSSLTWSPNDIWSVNWRADWQASQDNASEIRDYANSGNFDARYPEDINTGNFVSHNFSVRYNIRDDLELRAGVTNAFNAQQADYLGTTLYSNFDPYGRRFNIGLNWRPY